MLFSNIIKGTNTQNVVYNESFEIMRQFHKDFEEYVKAHQINFNEKDKIYYERRSNQYSSFNNISRSNIFNLRILTQSYVSTFLLEPNRGFEHEINLLEKFDGQIFCDDDEMYPYFISTLLYLKISKLFKEYYDAYRHLNKYKCQIMSLFIHIVAGRVPQKKNSLDSYCNKIETTILDEELFKSKIDESLKIFNNITAKWINLKGQEYSHSIKDSSRFVLFMLEELGFKYNKFNNKDKNDEATYVGYVTTVRQDRNGLFYCYIKADPVDIYAHQDDCPKTHFSSLAGKKVRYKIISYSKYSNPRGKIINVYAK